MTLMSSSKIKTNDKPWYYETQNYQSVFRSFPFSEDFFITEIFRMRNIFVLGLWGSMVRRGLAEDPRLVYNQSIYAYLFDDSHPNFGVYNKNSPPIRKDDMTRYYDGMEIFQHSIDKFVDHHCDPYINFLESKYLILQPH